MAIWKDCSLAMINGAEGEVTLESFRPVTGGKNLLHVGIYSFAVDTMSNDCRRTTEDQRNERCQHHTEKFPLADPNSGCFFVSRHMKLMEVMKNLSVHFQDDRRDGTNNFGPQVSRVLHRKHIR